MEQWNRIDRSKLYPKALILFDKLVINCLARGVSYYAICGTRSMEEQAALYAQGRTSPGKIVTNAKPGDSLHNYGLAIDGCKDLDQDRSGLQPSWNLSDYEIWAEEARKLGLEAGMDWTSFKEGPHVQYKVNVPMAKLKEWFAKGGLKEVWKNLDNG